MGATTVMTVGFRERERILRVFEAVTGLRMNNAYIRPGGRRPGRPARCGRHGPRGHRRAAPRPARARAAPQREPAPQGPHRRRRLPRPHRLHGAGHHRSRAPRRPACRTTCASRPRTAATRPTTSRSSPAPAATPTTACASASTRCTSRSRSSSSRLDRLQRTEGQPVMVEDKKIAWPAQLAIGGDGQGNSLDHIREIMGTSMESLIHHFKLVTEGFRVPPGPGLRRGRVGQGRARLPHRLRRRHPALPGALPRPELQQPAGRGRDVRGRPGRRRHRRRGLHRPRHGRCRPLMAHDFGLQTASGHLTVSEESKEPYAADVEAQLPRRRRRGHRALPAEALGAAAAAAPRAVGRRLRHRPRHRPVRRAARPHRPRRSPASRRSTRSTSATPTASTPSASAPTRCARSWAATRSGTPCPSTSASATTRPPTTARSPSSASSATRPATTPRSS